MESNKRCTTCFFVVSVLLFLIHNLTIMVFKLYLIILLVVIRLIYITLKSIKIKQKNRCQCGVFHGNYRIIYIR